MQLLFAFVELYVAPAIIAVGLVFFFYGVVNYFIMGPGDEGRREVGRQSLLWASLFFLCGLLIFGIFSWLSSFTDRLKGDVDAEVREESDILEVPNVPRAR